MTYHRKTNTDCKKHPVPICQIEDIIHQKQEEYFKETKRYLSIPRAIIKLITDGKQSL